MTIERYSVASQDGSGFMVPDKHGDYLDISEQPIVTAVVEELAWAQSVTAGLDMEVEDWIEMREDAEALAEGATTTQLRISALCRVAALAIQQAITLEDV